MQEKVKEALEGKITVEELTSEELVEFRKVASEEGRAELKKLTAFRQAKRDEEEKVRIAEEKRKKAEEDLANLENEYQTTKKEQTQFREEQIQKAKEKFYSEYKIDDSKKVEIEDTFKKLDSGKVDVDLIIKDLVRSYSAADPDSYISAVKKMEEMKKNADLHNQNHAGSHGAPPPGGDPKQYDEQTTQLATAAGITPEQAKRTVDQGMSRRY